ESGGLAQNLSSSVSSASAPLQENGASKEKTMSTRIFQAIREVKNEAIQVFLRVFKGEMEDARENAQSPEEAVILEKFAQTASHYMEKLEGAKTSTEVSQRVDELLDEQKDDTAIDRKAIIEAGARMYSEKFEKNEPLLRDFVDKYKGYFHENPRQIKRIINMIRFLCIARYYVEKELRGDGLGKIEDLPPDGAIFKFVAVTTLWPLATDYMKKNYKLADGREVSIFSLMEDVARDLKDKAAADVTWADFLASKNISDKWGVSSPEFRGLLAEGAGISRYVGRGLW
ncbi:MAG: hypothetical protein ABSG33_12385, partial [Candidatus Bathyarchaeia archaeon]